MGYSKFEFLAEARDPDAPAGDDPRHPNPAITTARAKDQPRPWARMVVSASYEEGKLEYADCWAMNGQRHSCRYGV